MTPEQREKIVELLESGEELDREWERIIFPPERREYELVYHGKEHREEVVGETMAVPLQPVRTFGKNGNGWHNMLVFGDNLQVCKTLLEMKKAGQLKNGDGSDGPRMVYIDPPFSTKQEFKGTRAQKAYQDKVVGSEFIEFLRKRLILLHELLADDGVLFLHIDWRKGHYLKIILDEIFGEHNFQNEIVWKRTGARSGSDSFNHIHDTIFLYSKSHSWFWDTQYTEYDPEYVEEVFKETDETGKRFQSVILTASGTRTGSSGLPWRGINPTEGGRHWAVPGFIRSQLRDPNVKDVRDALDQLDEMKRVIWPSKKDGIPRFKQYEDDRAGVEIQSIWTDVRPVSKRSKEGTGYPTQKPESLLERLMRSTTQEGDLVLDAFSGAGTTCAVAEKLGRKWVGIDCGKLSIYTMQKRFLNLRTEIGNKGKPIKCKPFTLYNAGLYDFSRLRELQWDAWRFFALQLFQCRDEPHSLGGIRLDGFLKGGDVMVFNHFESEANAKVTYETIESIHESLGSRIGRRFFIIAPSLSFAFQEDYVDRGRTRYYALRIPYSIINELHRREFTAIRQPSDEMAVNDTVESVGFDFIRTPKAKVSYRFQKEKEALFENLQIRINSFASDGGRSAVASAETLDALSTVLIDLDYNGEVFDLDQFHFADDLKDSGYTIEIAKSSLGERVMVVLIDMYGNEFREVKNVGDIGNGASKPAASLNRKTKKPVKKSKQSKR